MSSSSSKPYITGVCITWLYTDCSPCPVGTKLVFLLHIITEIAVDSRFGKFYRTSQGYRISVVTVGIRRKYSIRSHIGIRKIIGHIFVPAGNRDAVIVISPGSEKFLYVIGKPRRILPEGIINLVSPIVEFIVECRSHLYSHRPGIGRTAPVRIHSGIEQGAGVFKAHGTGNHEYRFQVLFFTLLVVMMNTPLAALEP